MKKLSICLFLVLFGFSAPSFADHLLKKSKEESLIVHKQRMNELPNNAHAIWKNYKNEIKKKFGRRIHFPQVHKIMNREHNQKTFGVVA